MIISEIGVPATGLSGIRVLLVQPVVIINADNPKKYIFTPGNELPLNVLCLATFLRTHAIDAKVLDLRIASAPWKELEQAIRDFEPRVVGITACSCEEIGASVTAAKVKAIDPSIMTVFGGIQASAEPETMISRYPQFDTLVVGEGEFSLLEIIQAVASNSRWESIEGTVVRTNGSVRKNPSRSISDSIDVFPAPDRSLIDIYRYYPNPITYNYNKLPTTGIIASRGCPYQCHHCSKGVWGNTVRFRSARSVFNEIHECVDRFGIRDFRFYDDVLTLQEGPLDKLCQLIIDNNLRISFNCYSRIDQISPVRLKLMRRAGCYHIKFGVESSSPRAIALSNRNTTTDDAFRAIQMTKDAGILVKATFIMGMPGEKEDDFDRTIALACALKPDLVSFGLFTLFPGSHFYQRITHEHDLELRNSILPPEIVLPYISAAYLKFYFSFAFITGKIQFLARRPGMWISELRRIIRGIVTLGWFFVRRSFNQA